MKEGGAYFQTRYSFDPHRKLLCEALINTDFQRWINAINAVLELGAGYGDFINFVRAARRITIDSGEDLAKYLDPNVDYFLRSVTDSTLSEITIETMGGSNADFIWRNEMLMK